MSTVQRLGTPVLLLPCRASELRSTNFRSEARSAVLETCVTQSLFKLEGHPTCALDSVGVIAYTGALDALALFLSYGALDFILASVCVLSQTGWCLFREKSRGLLRKRKRKNYVFAVLLATCS